MPLSPLFFCDTLTPCRSRRTLRLKAARYADAAIDAIRMAATLLLDAAAADITDAPCASLRHAAMPIAIECCHAAAASAAMPYYGRYAAAIR